MNEFFQKINKYSFLFKELVRRDFKKKYKGTMLGMVWSVLSPLAHLAVLTLVFTQLFGRNTPHYMIYVFCGTLVMSYFKEATKGGMSCLVSNKDIITKVNIPKYLFLFSKTASVFINFLITLVIFFLFCVCDHISFGWHMLALIFPIMMLTIFNIGCGLILSALFVFFKDTSYLYDIFLTLLNYLSVIFYQIDRFPIKYQRYFLCNPIYCFIKYFRVVVIDGHIPSMQYHLLIVLYTLLAFVIGCLIYKKNNQRFLYYM